MKKIEQVEEDIRNMCDDIRDHEKSKLRADKTAAKKLRKKLPVLRQCLKYLQSEPTETFVRNEISRIKTKIDLRMREFVFDEKLDLYTIAKMKKEHRKKYEIGKLEEQLKTLNYLLK